MGIFWVGIFWGEIQQGGNLIGGNFSGRSFPRGVFQIHIKTILSKKLRNILMVKKYLHFREFKETEIMKTTKKRPKNKVSTFKDIPVKNHDEFGSYLLSGTYKHVQRFCIKW